MEYKIEGDNLKVVKVTLKEGEEVYAEAGKMMFKTSSINMETKMKGKGIGAKTGLGGNAGSSRCRCSNHVRSIDEIHQFKDTKELIKG